MRVKPKRARNQQQRSARRGQQLELTPAMEERNDELDNATQEYLETLLEDYNLEWDYGLIGDVLQAAVDVLSANHGRSVRWPAIITNHDGSQEYGGLL